MDRARAIRIAENWSQGHVCTLREGEAQEYHKLCLAALREQEQREQGCEYCDGTDTDLYLREGACSQMNDHLYL